MEYYIGIDGGGSKTKAVLCDENLNILSSYTGKSINFNSVGIETARENLSETADGLTKGKNIIPAGVCIGCAALSQRADKELTDKLCDGIFSCENIILDSDLFIALEAMNRDGPCAVAICGTGSMAAGRTDSEIIHTGGFGFLLGDEGSGYAIASDAFRAALRYFDKTGDETELTGKIRELSGLKNQDDIFDFVYRNPVPVTGIASFAKTVCDCAENGDKTALEIINKNAESFAATVRGLLRQMPAGTPLGLWGGIMQNCGMFREIFIKSVKKEFFESEICLLEYPPETGAAMGAVKAFGKK